MVDHCDDTSIYTVAVAIQEYNADHWPLSNRPLGPGKLGYQPIRETHKDMQHTFQRRYGVKKKGCDFKYRNHLFVCFAAPHRRSSEWWQERPAPGAPGAPQSEGPPQGAVSGCQSHSELSSCIHLCTPTCPSLEPNPDCILGAPYQYQGERKMQVSIYIG